MWMTCAYFCLLLPFTAELAFIPIIGGCLLCWHSQSATIFVFSLLCAVISYSLVAGILWIKFKPLFSVFLAFCFAATMIAINKIGEPVP